MSKGTRINGIYFVEHVCAHMRQVLSSTTSGNFQDHASALHAFNKFKGQFMGLPQLQELIAALKGDNQEARLLLPIAFELVPEEMILKALQPEQIEIILAACEDSDPGVRSCAIAIGSLISDDRAWIKTLVALRDMDPHVRKAAIGAVCKKGAETAVQHVIPALEDPDIEVRQLAVKVSQNLRDHRIIEALIAVLAKPELGISKVTAIGLNKITGHKFFFGNEKPEKWQVWWANNRQRFVRTPLSSPML
jgi:HEAT repeats